MSSHLYLHCHVFICFLNNPIDHPNNLRYSHDKVVAVPLGNMKSLAKRIYCTPRFAAEDRMDREVYGNNRDIFWEGLYCGGRRPIAIAIYTSQVSLE